MSKLRSTSHESYVISSDAFKSLMANANKHDISKDVNWTDDIRVELPVRKSRDGVGSLQPTTLIQQFKKSSRLYGDLPALSSKVNGQWVAYNYRQYYNHCINFARALIAYSVDQFTSINIIGFNAPQWHIAFFGSLFGRCLPIGIYTTNNQSVCEYLVKHSHCQVVIAENMEYASKYINLLNQGVIKLIIIYNDGKAIISQEHRGKIVQWNHFMKEGSRVEVKYVEERMDKVKPGNCCTLVYTSGTTGMPKAVMISHDNFTWTKRSLDAHHQRQMKHHRMVSYLPLSHIAAQFSDITNPMIEGFHIYFADPSALQGTLIQTLLEVRPTIFFSVPRVWEKIYEKMMEIAKSNGWLKTKIATWAKGLGMQGVVNESVGEKTSWQYKLAKILVFNQVKKALGLDQCEFFLYGAAPLNPEVRKYFATLGILLINSYGMSQTTAPQNLTHPSLFKKNAQEIDLKEVGKCIPGTVIKIDKLSPNDEDGEMCFRGRNIFMGYYQNAQETKKCLDSEGYLKSGDVGKLSPEGSLKITGRAKQLIITAGGENIPPILIENQILAAMPFISNVMLVGQGRKFLTCLIAVQQDPPASGKIKKSAQQYLSLKGCEVKSIEEARTNPKIHKIVLEGLKKANQKAISKAQNVQNFYIMPQDFTVENGLLTPTLKLKRKQVLKRYEAEIQQMYTVSKL